MIYLSLGILCIFFIELFILFNVFADVRSVLIISREAFATLSSKQLSDDEKEMKVRRYSLDIGKSTLVFMSKGVLIGVFLYALYHFLLIVFSLSDVVVIEVALLLSTILAMTLFSLFYTRLRSVIIQRI